MYRLVYMTSTWYALRIGDLEEDMQNIQEFVESGDVVILVDDLSDVGPLFGEELDVADITIVES